MSPLRFAVVGSPVAHSRSPAMHGAAFRALGLPHVYEKAETTAEELPARVDALRRGELAGMNVTVPHKTRALALADEVDASARATGAANTLVRLAEGRVRAHNTDAPALAAELGRLAQLPGPEVAFAGKTGLVIGTGGAARAAIFALGTLGFARVLVRGRREVPELGAILAPFGAVLTPEGLAREGRPEPANLAAIVQTTTSGMNGSGVPGAVAADAVDWASVPPGCVVLDAVYAPPRTPFLERAAGAGLRNDGGFGMLARQGALAFELWLGIAPPLDVMLEALVR